MTNRGIRFIALAGLLIGAIVFCPAAGAAAAIDPRPDPDACSLLSSMDLIATADRRVVTGEFRTDDFDVRGLGDLSIYPATGDVFTVRYLPHHPQDFMIRNDDQSPWARKLACSRLGTWKADALRQASAAPGDASFGREAARAMSTEQAAGCQ